MDKSESCPIFRKLQEEIGSLDAICAGLMVRRFLSDDEKDKLAAAKKENDAKVSPNRFPSQFLIFLQVARVESVE